jgi:hypothetical protein
MNFNFAATTGGSRKNRKNSRKAERKSRKNSRKAERKSRKASRKNTRRNMYGGEGMNANAANAKLPSMLGPEGAIPEGFAQLGGAMKTIGTRAEVMHGSAHHTSGGLTRKDLKYNKHGRIVSRKASAAGKKALKRLEKAGYKAKKGTFKLFKKGSRRH